MAATRFGAWLRDAMARAGIASQAELARRLDVSEATVSRWFSARHGLDQGNIAALAKVLSVTQHEVYVALGVLREVTDEELALINQIAAELDPRRREVLTAVGQTLLRQMLEETPAQDDEE